MGLLDFFFIVALLAIFHAYIGYPVSLMLFGFFIAKDIQKAPYFPFVTLIITAHNEELRIREKLVNTLNLIYPKERLQIVVASDGSTDKTNEIVQCFRDKGIELLEITERVGKENAQKRAIEKAKGEILVFSDVATHLDPDGLNEIVYNFADPSVGCVSSEDRLITREGQPSGEGFYVKYEMWLRDLESKVNTLVGLSGSFFAARKNVFYDFSGQMQSDFRTLLNAVKVGLRGVSDPKAIGYYLDVGNDSREFERKVRTVLRGLTVFFHHLEFLNFSRYGIFSYQYFCHKLLRWLVPFLLCLAFFSNLLLAMLAWPYTMLFLAQLVFYTTAIWGFYGNVRSTKSLARIPTYFLIVNASILAAWCRFLLGHRTVMWKPSER